MKQWRGSQLLKRAVFGVTGFEGVKTRVWELLHEARSVHSRSNNGGLIGSTEFMRLATRNHGEYKFLNGSSTEPRPGYVAHKQERSTLKEAVAELMDRVNEGISVSSYAYNHILKWCANERDLESVKQMHDSIKDSQMEQHPYVGSMLIKCYIECGRLETAEETLNTLLKKSTVNWTTMIVGCVKHDQAESAIEIYKKMRNEDGRPDAATYVSVLKACASPTALKWGKEIHAHIIRDGFEANVRVGTALVRMYAKCGSLENARTVFGKISRRDVVSWNVMIGALAEHRLGHEAFSLFLRMQREGFSPDAITYLSILNPCCCTGAMEWVKEVHAHAAKANPDVDVRVKNALVQMYAKSGSIEDAKAVFSSMGRRNNISWNGMIGALAEQGLGHEAYSLFLQMQREGFTPTAITYLSILNPCSSRAAVEWVKEIHFHAVEAGLDVGLEVGNALVQMYAKTGLIANAKRVFEKMQIRDVISWVVMIGGLAQHGEGREALQYFEKMKSEGVKPNDAVFVAVLSACSHTGLVQEGLLLFESMKPDHGIEPALEHHTCMVDMLGRAGRLEDAQRFIVTMPMKPDLVTWLAFLGACRTHKNVELAEVAATECLKFKPKDAAPYVLLSNVYAAAGDWDRVTHVRNLMEKRGIRKEPGLCWIEVGDKVHQFQVGDTSHPETREIYTLLSSLSEKLKAEGYTADTRLVLRNVAEEDKESALCSHSEKLAIAYGLMHVPLGKPIRVYKNLRICTDCHTASKLISSITGREIVARDANRFHHFKYGSCSCDDYW